MAVKAKTGAPAPARGSKLTIGFGLVNVDVKYAPLVASGTGRTSAKTCCRTHMAPVGSEYRCTEGGELVDPADKVMAYDIDGQYLEVNTDSIGLERDGRLELTAVVDQNAIDPLYFEKPYVVWPQSGHEQAFDLIASILRTSGKCVVGQTVMGKATRVIVLRWSEVAGTLVAHTCLYDERIAWADVQLVRSGAEQRPALPEALLAQGSMLLGSLDADGFDFGTVTDEYAVALDEAIALPRPASQRSRRRTTSRRPSRRAT